MGYQITQFFSPTNTDGKVSFYTDNFTTEHTVTIKQAHMETDTAKMIHDQGSALLDFNRAGTPLVEIVTGPDFSSIDEVNEFLKELQRIVRYNDIGDADMEKGQMRVDVNISIRPDDTAPLGTRVELKNINSFGAVRRAVEIEYARQVALYDAGESFEQQTRGWDDAKGESYLMRKKSDNLDYRYFPEPDLPALQLTGDDFAWLDTQKIEIPHHIIRTCKEQYGFNKEYINALIGDKTVLDYFLACIADGAQPKTIAKWLTGPIAAFTAEQLITLEQLSFDRSKFIAFCTLADSGTINDNQAKEVLAVMLQTGESAADIVREK